MPANSEKLNDVMNGVLTLLPGMGLVTELNTPPLLELDRTDIITVPGVSLLRKFNLKRFHR